MKSRKLAFARVTLEAVSPLIVSTGGGDDLADAVCVADANGVPMIPGTSLAGVLRHGSGLADCDAPNVFGYQRRDEGQRSQLVVQHALAHDASDRPVDPRPRATPADDDVLRALRNGVVRDHVRLNGDGVADATGKFDERLVPRGARFTFDAWLEGAGDPAGLLAKLAEVLAVLAREGASLGGRTRRGFGLVRVVRAFGEAVDLEQEAGRTRWRSFQRGEPLRLAPLTLAPAGDGGGRVATTLHLAPEDYWIFGRGEDCEDELPNGRTRRTQITPYREDEIVWRDGATPAGSVRARGGGLRDERPAVVAATGIKGALRHCTLFHARRLVGAWHGADGAQELAAQAAVRLLFGHEPSRGSEERGHPGRVHVHDARVESPTRGRLDHVSIDRFTGAPIDGALFGEEPLFGGRLPVGLAVDLTPLRSAVMPADDPPDATPQEREARRRDREEAERTAEAERAGFRLGLRAFLCALDDLCRGRLPVGGGAGRGHGYVRADVPRAFHDAIAREVG